MSDTSRLAAYAKRFGAGAFATPSKRDIEHLDVEHWNDMIAVGRVLERTSKRNDWTGRPYWIPAGARLVTHLARDLTAPVPPELNEWGEYLITYVEDFGLAEQLRAWDRAPVAHVITAAGELKAVWQPPRWPEIHVEDRWDRITIRKVHDVYGPALGNMRDELQAITARWDDDYPFYSDGTWSALSLRGFWGDPSKGVKPAEMPKAWQAQHPGSLAQDCEWTVLSDACPTMRDCARSLGRLERVRLMRMTAKAGGGKLGRHTDITDRAAGTRDGQIMRFHVPLVTDPSVTFSTWDLDGTRTDTHLAPGTVWYFDARKPHAVSNPSSVDRVHLVCDVIADPAARALVLAG